MAADYSITATQPTAYTDANGQFREGYKVFVFFKNYGETHTLNVPNLNTAELKKSIEDLLAQRKALANL